MQNQESTSLLEEHEHLNIQEEAGRNPKIYPARDSSHDSLPEDAVSTKNNSRKQPATFSNPALCENRCILILGIVFYLIEIVSFNFRAHSGYLRTDFPFILDLGVHAAANVFLLMIWFFVNRKKLEQKTLSEVFIHTDITTILCVLLWAALLVCNFIIAFSEYQTRWLDIVIDCCGYIFLICFWKSYAMSDAFSTGPLVLLHICFFLSRLVTNFVTPSGESQTEVAYLYSIIENIILFEIFHLICEVATRRDVE